MKFSSIISFFVFFLFLGNKSLAQTPPYLVVVKNEVYNDLTSPIELTSVGDFWDDPGHVVPIGFEFDLMGVVSDTFYINSELPGAMVIPVDAEVQSVTPVIVVHSDDLADREAVDPNLQSTISYQLEGTPGERILKMEWKEAGFYIEISNNNTANNYLSFQLWLYEGTNSFDIRFGPANYDNSIMLHDLLGPTCGIIDTIDLYDESLKNFWALTGSPQDPDFTKIPLASLFMTQLLSDNPTDGLVYQFINPLTATENFVDNHEMKIYPTLFRNDFFVEIKNEVLSEETTFFLNDQLGRPIYNKTITETKTNISLDDLPTGIYFATIYNKNGIGTQKIIKVD